ncbi:cupin-like domain-containing protein [Thalassotalea sp. PLHSN55]|uniref:cupin-like domain-containing protein n=1 Tax=Thalassotalea sp. PLHSN55 TaxID=3435888 RepID=UPI003F860E73
MDTQTSTVRTLTGITPNNISPDILNATSPILLKGFALEWALVKQGLSSADDAAHYLATHYQGAPVNACLLDEAEQGRVFYNQDFTGFNFSSESANLTDVLQKLLSVEASSSPQSTIYVGSTSMKHFFPTLVEPLSVTGIPQQALFNIWLGGKTNVAAHFDAAQNLACSAVGSRTFTLFPPDQIDNLYIGPLDKAPGGQPISLVDMSAPDFERFPRFKTALAHAKRVTLAPGDALIIPSMWWHQVQGNHRFNVLLNYWWQQGQPYAGQANSALLHAILAIRDLPVEQRKAWQNLFNFYVFEHNDENFDHIPETAKSILSTPLDAAKAKQLRSQLQNMLRR